MSTPTKEYESLGGSQRPISPAELRATSNSATKKRRQASEHSSRRRNAPFANGMVREIKTIKSEDEEKPNEANSAQKSQATNYNEDEMLAEFMIIRTLRGGENVEYLVRVFDKGQREEGTGRHVI